MAGRGRGEVVPVVIIGGRRGERKRRCVGRVTRGRLRQIEEIVNDRRGADGHRFGYSLSFSDVVSDVILLFFKLLGCERMMRLRKVSECYGSVVEIELEEAILVSDVLRMGHVMIQLLGRKRETTRKYLSKGPCPGGSLDHIAGGRRQRVTVPGLFLQSSMVQTNINSTHI